MSRIKNLFERKPNRVLNVYCTAGYPGLNDTLPLLRALQTHGADLVELGMPYSDPLADGPVIQHSSSIALANGMTLRHLFGQLSGMRRPVSEGGIGDQLPVILMGYMNPVMQYGFEQFCSDAANAGIDGLILPDLPIYEFESEYGPIIRKYGLDIIFLVTPETSAERIARLDSLSSGFLYAVSSSSTTGSDKNMNLVTGYLEKLRALPLKNPVLVGFGIKDKASFDQATAHASGAIIGTAFIKALENSTDLDATTSVFLSGILK